MSFRDAVVKDSITFQRGENGSLEYTNIGLGSEVLAISQLVRGGDPTNLINRILITDTTTKVDSVVDLFTLIFVTRNTRGGKGEKKLAFDIYLKLLEFYPQTCIKMLRLFPHYGYWKDLLLLCEEMSKRTKKSGATEELEMLLHETFRIIKEQLQKDIDVLEEEYEIVDGFNGTNTTLRRPTKNISLIAKWLPREGSHFDRTLGFVALFSEFMWPTSEKNSINQRGDNNKYKRKQKYRQTITKLTSHLNLPEVYLSAQRGDEINFAKVASKATLRLTPTFLNENKDATQRSYDPKRIRMSEIFIEYITKNGAKGKQVMPHEIVREILYNYKLSRARELVLDSQWKDVWKAVVEDVKEKVEAEGLDFNLTQMVPISDVSGSMFGVPMEVSIALGIGISEITHASFRNMIMTFDENPQWHILKPEDTIVQKVRSLQAAPWGFSTNFERAFELILKTCKENKLSYEEIPSLIVFSDMQFNEASNARGDESATMFRHMERRMASVANELDWAETNCSFKPIIFWNLRNTGGHPVDKDTQGTVLLSGFSPSLLELVLNGEALKEEEIELVDGGGNVQTVKVRITPEEILRKMLDDSLYDPVREILLQSNEGVFSKYICSIN